MKRKSEKRQFTKSELKFISEYGKLHPGEENTLEDDLETKVIEKSKKINIDENERFQTVEQEIKIEDYEEKEDSYEKLLKLSNEKLEWDEILGSSDVNHESKELEGGINEVSVEEESDEGEESEGEVDDSTDFFSRHLNPESFDVKVEKPVTKPLSALTNSTVSYTGTVDKIHPSMIKAGSVRENFEKSFERSDIHKELDDFVYGYKDVLLPYTSHEQHPDLESMYALHVLNHCLKTRNRILKNNERLKKNPDLELRDQGYTRPKCLIVLPFKCNAFQFINKLISLSGIKQVSNLKRFKDEFGPSDDDADVSRKPEDYKYMLKGNPDDSFKIGIKLTRKTIKLYSEFYGSDLIVASPLGLRLILASKDKKKKDNDFLSSIEILVLDRAHVFGMQNWDHIDLIMENINKLPTKSHDADISRIRSFYLDGLGSKVRQTLVFTEHLTPEINHLFSKSCSNYSGYAKVKVEYPGTMTNILRSCNHLFYKVPVESIASSADDRFNYFIFKILPVVKDALQNGHVCLFVPSYFDFVRIRNHLTSELYSFNSLSEYTSDKDISRTRTSFFKGEVPLLLVTERFVFFKRYRIRGIEQIFFYQLPDNGTFYSEIINFLEEKSQICALFSKYDVLKLNQVVGNKKASKMIRSEKDVFLFST